MEDIRIMSQHGNADSRNMKQLKDEQTIRQRPAPTFGTNDERGAFHSVDEIVMNSVDEATEGHGDYIEVEVRLPNEEELGYGASPDAYVVSVEDNGRGLPMGWNEEEGVYNWVLALCTLYASGKYDSSQYSNSLGLNGLGLTATQYASSFMNVWSTYDGKTRFMHFEKGRPVGQMKEMAPVKECTGTRIVFQPDPEVFPALRKVKLDSNMFIPLLNSQAMLVGGLKLVLKHADFGGDPKTFYYQGGIAEFVDKVIEENSMLPKAIEFFDKDTGTDDPDTNPENYDVKMKMAFNFCRDASLIQVFHNGSRMSEGGKTVDGLEIGITKAFTDVAKANGKLTRADKFSFKDIESMLVCVASTEAPGHRTWFKSQTKTAINNPFIGSAFMQFVYSKVRYWLETNKAQADKVIAEALINKQAREEGDAVSKKVINTLGKQVSFGNKPKDFKDCTSKNVFERELYIVEGRSALGSVKFACNPKFQATIPVRGKIINCLKEKITRVLNNDIIIDLYRVLGCGMEVKSKHIENLPQFDITKLNWGKIIICTDADVDGNHIRCLLITMFYILSPSLLKAGKVFIAETPLYEITWKNDTKFAYDDNEKEAILNDLRALGAKDSQIKIQRSKGLGENDPEMMSISTMRPDTRRLIPIEYPENDADLMVYFNALLGDDLETRRILIDEYFDLTPSNLD